MYGASIYLMVNAIFVTLFIGICSHCNAFSKQFHYLSQRLDPTKPNQSLSKLIKFHLAAKKLVEDLELKKKTKRLSLKLILFSSVFFETADVYSAFIWIVMLCSMMYTACSVFQLDLV